MKTLREEFWEDGAVKQQRPSARRLKVKGTKKEKERPRNNEVIGTLNGPGKTEGEWGMGKMGSGDRGWPYGTARNQGLSACIAGFNRQRGRLAGKQAKTQATQQKIVIPDRSAGSIGRVGSQSVERNDVGRPCWDPWLVVAQSASPGSVYLRIRYFEVTCDSSQARHDNAMCAPRYRRISRK